MEKEANLLNSLIKFLKEISENPKISNFFQVKNLFFSTFFTLYFKCFVYLIQTFFSKMYTITK